MYLGKADYGSRHLERPSYRRHALSFFFLEQEKINFVLSVPSLLLIDRCYLVLSRSLILFPDRL